MTPPTNHFVNAGVALAPLVSVLSQLPVIVSTLVGICALFYYYLVITKELRARAAEREQIRQSGKRVVAKVKADDALDGDAP